MFDDGWTRRTVTTNDGVEISLIEAGQGQPFLMIHGWSQSALQWHHQIRAFCGAYRVLALDMRGHGHSQKPNHGYRVYRLAQDVKNVIDALRLERPILMGHSMGAAVIWALIDLYGDEDLAKLILVDEPAYLSKNPALSEEERQEAGALLSPDDCFSLVATLKGPEDAAIAKTRAFVGAMFTPNADQALVDAAIEENFAFPRHHAATLVADHVHNDWRDVIGRITRPTLCVAGKANAVRFASVTWQAAVIPGAELVTFEPDEGGAHFMFMENPEKFNRAVAAFLAKASPAASVP